MLDELEAYEIVSLPAKRLHKAPGPRSPTLEPKPTTPPFPETPLTASLDTLTPITLRRVVSKEDRTYWKAALQTHQY